MEENINIAEILKDKKNGIILYSPIFGECTFSLVREKTDDICVKKYNGDNEFFDSKGLYSHLGEVMLFPSKEMRDWSKFSWKKGDLLINSCGFQCIFKEWASDDYTKFNGCYSNSRDSYEDVSNADTANFVKLDNNTAYGYVREIERKLGGILNLQTLEIEKPEFKDGDIVVYGKSVAICRKICKHTLFPYVSPDECRLATEEEKQQLFDALAKEGKRWDSEKKQIVDLKPKVDELKPFDKVVVRCSKADRWSIDFFSYKVHNGYICTGDAWYQLKNRKFVEVTE